MKNASNIAASATDETSESVKAKDPLWKRLYLVFSLFVMAALVAHFAWVASGAAVWKLAKDEDGIKVYTMKVPGDAALRAKTVMEGEYTLAQLTSQHISGIGDTLELCIDWMPGCKDYERIMDFDPVRGYDRDMWRVELPGPFVDREFLITTMFQQDKRTKKVTLDVVAMPNSLPHTPGVVRFQRAHNRWTYTPKANGKVEVALVQDVGVSDIGFIPYFLLNMLLVEDSHQFFATKLRPSLNEEVYRNAKLDFIDDIR